MKIAILSRNRKLYSTRRLVEAAETRGHAVRVIDPLRCYMNISARKPLVMYKGESLDGFDAVIPRIGSSITFYGNAVLRQFEMMGVYCANESVAIARARDKLRSMQLLARAGVAMPITGFANSPHDVDDVIRQVGGAPLVVKLLSGSQGIGVVLAETQQAAESVIEAFMELKADILVQECIQEAKGTDVRVLVVGGKVVAAMRRRAKPGEFRANIHRGGHGEKLKLSAVEKSLAIQAAKTIGLNIAGVDLLQATNGPVVIEVNSTPGLEGIENTTGVNVAEQIINFIEKNARPGRTGTKGQG